MTSTGRPLSAHQRAAVALRRATGALSTSATARMAAELPWFARLSAEDRSWVGLIVQAGVRGFVDWFDAAGDSERDPAPLAAAVFGSAPRELTGVITLEQTVELIRVSIATVEAELPSVLAGEELEHVHEAVLRYAREVAFATAEVYARAAESRGAWDARLEALIVDAVLRAETDDTVLSRASALGWTPGAVSVVVGNLDPGSTAVDAFDAVRRSARAAGLDALCALQGDRLVVVLHAGGQQAADATPIVQHFGDGPVVTGPTVADLTQAHESAAAALLAHAAAPGWPQAPRPVAADDLLPERLLVGDDTARGLVLAQVHAPLAARPALLETVDAWLAHSGSIEATARALFVHPNTVRYRLRQVADETGVSPSDPRGAFTLQLALIVGRQASVTAAL
jgi:hypothetical protein